MRIHCNATTSPKQRRFFQMNGSSCRELARIYLISPTTVSKWKKRSSLEDASARPKTIVTAFSPEEQDMILSLRKLELSIDDILDAIAQVLPKASRSSVHRLLVRHGLNRLPRPAKEPSGGFKEYQPGYLHIDCFYLPRVDTVKRYCYVAVDRATRLVFLRVYTRKTKEVAVDFLGRCLAFYPFMIHRILTDNGHEYTNATFKNRWGNRTKNPHPFGEICAAVGIDHRRTRPYTPKTNGLVERLNGLIQEATTKRHTYRDASEMIEDLDNWSVYYNFYRRHRQIGRRTPYEMSCEYYRINPNLFIKEPANLLGNCPQRGET
jgi:transposase InsO family protein